MKKSFKALALLFMAGSLLSAHAAAVKIDSIYSNLSGNSCEGLDGNEQEGWAKGRCKGTAGYNLVWQEDDIRQALDVIDPSGKAFPLDLWTTVSSGFSSLGDKAEWRVEKRGKQITPIAMIVRYNVSEDPEKPEKTTSYLVVSKITADEVCVTDVVKPAGNANQQARDLADVAASKPCKSNGESADSTISATSRQLDATIVSYECGDNCYLNIKDEQGEEYTGLCTAPLCDNWNEVAAMPDSFKGKRVRVTVGEGQQFDGGGNLMGTMDAFESIELSE
ncbi:MAG: hypothetical protein KJ914_15965 [Gammaproteobacteria bacterium]|nr:hypothetical protein [Gammaproteobacteria bacterium]MBU1725276.1 hypothetical protein [Gammaproteobacteria bacterium]MBU2006780.1 hypothetical protein [Gammaproteobacteria bacterium]